MDVGGGNAELRLEEETFETSLGNTAIRVAI